MAKRGRRGRTLAQLEQVLHKLNAQRSAVLAEIKTAVERLSFGGAAPLAGLSITSRVEVPKNKGGRRPGFKLSAEARAKISAAQKRRWAKTKHAEK
jgi:hypothetical protein